MYVKVQDGLVVQYPYSVKQLRAENPNTSFPRVVSDDILSSYGVFYVERGEKPVVDQRTHKAILSETPEQVSGTWVLLWSIVEKTEDEKQAYINECAENIRMKRKAFLESTDWIVIMHTEKGTNIPMDWEVYRQALRDITDQPGFPFDVTWPVKPE